MVDPKLRRGSRNDPLKRSNQKLNRTIFLEYVIKNRSVGEIAKLLGVKAKFVSCVVRRTAAKATFREIVDSIVDKIYKKNEDMFQKIVDISTKKIVEFLEGSDPIDSLEKAQKLVDIIERINEIIQRDISKEAQGVMVYPALPAGGMQKLITHTAQADPIFEVEVNGQTKKS